MSETSVIGSVVSYSSLADAAYFNLNVNDVITGYSVLSVRSDIFGGLDAFGLVNESGTEIVVAVRGSQQPGDYMTDFVAGALGLTSEVGLR